MKAPDIVIRRAEESDSEFAYQTVERTMKGYALAIWGTWLEAEARKNTASDANSGRSQIIQLGSERIGVLCVDRLAAHHELSQLYIVPEHQRQGIGVHVLQLVLSEAQAVAPRGCVVSETPERFFMERVPV